MDETPPPDPAGSPGEVFAAFLRQGLTAFGGSLAHIGYFRREFVERRAWLSEGAFADLLALAQFLPGPASSQLGMAIGLRRAGYAGLLAAWLGFTLPAAAAMVALAYLLPLIDVGWGDGVLHGLKLAAAAVVAQVVAAMARSLAAEPIRAGIALGATAGLLVAHGPVPQILALSAGAVFGLALLREPAAVVPDDPAAGRTPRGVPLAALAVFALALGGLPFLAPERWRSATARPCCRCCTPRSSSAVGWSATRSWRAMARPRPCPARSAALPASSAPPRARRRPAGRAASSRSWRSARRAPCWSPACCRSGTG